MCEYVFACVFVLLVLFVVVVVAVGLVSVVELTVVCIPYTFPVCCFECGKGRNGFMTCYL